jgi:16S rRNA (uracil1498-N3)-methyltransferase
VELVVIDAWMVEREQPEVWLAQSLAKQGRDEQAVEQATEVGVDRVIPLGTERAVVKWEGAKKTSGHERWQRIVREATKQSLQPYLAPVDSLHSLTELLERPDIQLIALDHRADKSILDVPIEPLPGAPAIVLAVGPEGGWSDSEKGAIVAAGGGVAKLGDGVLRASSAGPIALALMRARLRQW